MGSEPNSLDDLPLYKRHLTPGKHRTDLTDYVNVEGARSHHEHREKAVVGGVK